MLSINRAIISYDRLYFVKVYLDIISASFINDYIYNYFSFNPFYS